MNLAVSKGAGHTKRLQTHRAGAAVLAAFAVAAFVVVPGQTAAAVATRSTPSSEASAAAVAGSDWLAGRLTAEIPLQVFGSPSWGATLDAATALAAVDAEDPLVADVWDAAVADREVVVNDGTNDIVGGLAKMILLAHTLNKDPRSVGTAPGQDLVARLVATMTPSGSPDEGLFGVQSPTYDGVYRQGLAFAALASAGVTPDPLALAWLLDQQCIGDFEGSWMSYRVDTSVACVSDSVNWIGPDSNATSLALSGLHEAASDQAGVDDAIDRGLDWLDSEQNPNGGWGGYPWSDSDPNSIAVVLQALIANGVDKDARFADQTATPVAALLSFQLGASAPEADRGAFTYPGTGNSPSDLATVQAVVAAAGYPVVFRPEPPADPTPTTTTVPPTTTPTGSGPTTVPSTNAAGNSVDGAARPIRLAG